MNIKEEMDIFINFTLFLISLMSKSNLYWYISLYLSNSRFYIPLKTSLHLYLAVL